MKRNLSPAIMLYVVVPLSISLIYMIAVRGFSVWVLLLPVSISLFCSMVSIDVSID